MRNAISVLALLFLWVLLAVIPCRAQREFNVWAFGDGGGVDFNGPIPAAFNTAIRAQEGCAAIADRNTGALLFYTDGVSVYNRIHWQMPNGSGLFGDLSSTQSALIVPAPGTPDRYWLFTTDAGEYTGTANVGMYYSIVDMTLAGGMGDVAAKNVPLAASSTEKLTAIRTANGCGYWIIAHGWENDSFYVFRLSDQGLDPAPLIAGLGTVHHDVAGNGRGTGTIGYMKASPDGTRLAVALFTQRRVDLLRFDAATGALAFEDSLDLPEEPYGVAFSPDNRRLYVSCEPAALYQYDLADAAPGAIAASRALVSNATDSNVTQRYGALQLAPDGRIYHARVNGHWLGAITAPNNDAAGCAYTLWAIDVGHDPHLGLPNLIDGFFANGDLKCGSPLAEFSPADTTICEGNCINLRDLSTNNPTTWNWSFPGALTATSTAQHPVGICYAVPGTYRITLVVASALGTSSRTHTIVVLPRGDLRTSIRRDYHVAPGDTLLVPLTLDAPYTASALDSLTLTVRFSGGMLKLAGFDNSGGLTNGWRIDSLVVDQQNGHCTARLAAPAGTALQGAGVLAVLRFIAFMGSCDTSEIALEVAAAGSPCLAANAVPGLVHMVFCGVRNRLIELTGPTFALHPNRPNPFNPTTIIPFTLGADGHVLLIVRDLLGREVARLADADMRAGDHTVTWDAARQPSGLYTCTITSGDWKETEWMMVAK